MEGIVHFSYFSPYCNSCIKVVTALFLVFYVQLSFLAIVSHVSLFNTLEIEFNSEEMYKNGKLDVSIRMVGFQPYRVRIITIFKDNVFGIRNMVFHN